MTFLECLHSLVLCPGVRAPRRRCGVVACSNARCSSGWVARGFEPARHERSASPRRAGAHRLRASPRKRRAGTCTHAAARPPAGTFSWGERALPSGRPRRSTPESRSQGLARSPRGIVPATGDLLEGSREARGNVEVADQAKAHLDEPDRCGAGGAAEAKGTQVSLTVSGHQGPDEEDLALRVAGRQWDANGRCRETRLSRLRVADAARRVRWNGMCGAGFFAWASNRHGRSTNRNRAFRAARGVAIARESVMS
jgi:hypothetical protein